jgi:hypothetical protein
MQVCNWNHHIGPHLVSSDDDLSHMISMNGKIYHSPLITTNLRLPRVVKTEYFLLLGNSITGTSMTLWEARGPDNVDLWNMLLVPCAGSSSTNVQDSFR